MEVLHKIESQRCTGCLNDLGDDDYVTALGQEWHKDCFRCSVCDCALSLWYFEKDGLLFCQADYWQRFGDSCHQCDQVITGPVMSAGEHRYHPECFTCCACSAHIEDEQPYALVERTRLYCGSCYSRAGSFGPRLVAVPSQAVSLPADQRSSVQLATVDGGCGLLAMHLGDRILEINGTPVHKRPDVERVLSRPDPLVQLTIEHNPDTNRIPMCNIKAEERDCMVKRQDKPTERKDNISPVERRIHKENIPKNSSGTVDEQRQEKHDEEESGAKKERLFKRKGEGGGGKARVIRRRQTPVSPLLADKERSSSMSKLLDVVDSVESERAGGVLCDLSRARSFRVEPASSGQKVFRAQDLVQGELLGCGFFGEVYKVTHRETREVMVLKQLYRLDDEAQKNFLKEVAVLRSLHHPNVLRFVGVLYRDKRLHLVTEYVPGGTLYQLIQDPHVELSWLDRARLARDVAAGVGYLHRMNVIHRDLNSHNCLVREDKTVVVADFGLARIVQRTASSSLHRCDKDGHNTLRRKRYTVVGNPYWMAPEMMNGNVYDEKVDVFSFGIICCEIIGRVSADPDFLPRRGDFGLNEAAFATQFCADAPPPLLRLACLACNIEPDHRPPFEVIEIWLESLVMHLAHPAPLPPSLLADMLQYGRGGHEVHATPLNASPCSQSMELINAEGVVKSKSNATLLEPPSRSALGKCVSASHIAAPRVVTVTSLSRSQQALHPGYIVRARGPHINITKVDDIRQWLDSPPPLKRTSPDSQLNHLSQDNKTRKVDTQDDAHLPSFLRNQSVEGLESKCKLEIEAPATYCRHSSIPDHTDVLSNDSDSDSSEDLEEITNWHRNVSAFPKFPVRESDKNRTHKEVNKANDCDTSIVTLRNANCLTGERKIPEEDCRRYNIHHLAKTPMMAEGIKNIPKTLDFHKHEKDKSGFLSKMSPKLSRLFRHAPSEADTKDDEDKSRSKFFVQSPVSPIGRTYKVRPVDNTSKAILNDKKIRENNLLKSDVKLASMGKPMTPIFRRHIPSERPDFADGRFSYRERRTKDFKSVEPRFMDVGRNRIKAPVPDKNTKVAPLIRSTHTNNIPALATVPEKKHTKSPKPVRSEKDSSPKKQLGISKSNYVSLANLRINGKPKDLENCMPDTSPEQISNIPADMV